jgi:hypothetical protein
MFSEGKQRPKNLASVFLGRIPIPAFLRDRGEILRAPNGFLRMTFAFSANGYDIGSLNFIFGSPQNAKTSHPKFAIHSQQNRMYQSNLFRFCTLLSCLLLACFCSNLLAQDKSMGEMEIIQAVTEIQRELESPDSAARDAAERKLLNLGPLALDHLEPPSSNAPADVEARLLRVRLALEKIAVAAVTQASTVSLAGEMSAAEALSKIKLQTGNDVAIHEQVPDSFGQRTLKLNLSKVEFWTALNEIFEAAELEIDPYGGGPGKMRLVPSPAGRAAAANPAGSPVAPPANAKTVKRPRNISGVFDLTVNKISSTRNLANPKLNHSVITVLVRWEPRVQPISIDLPISSIKAIDEFDAPIPIGNEEAVMSGIVQPEIPELEFSIPIGLVDRQIETIKTFEATIDAVLPGRVETFKFKNLGRIEDETERRKAGAIVTFGGIRKNDDLYGVTIRLSFDDEHNALASHQGWAFNNPLYLETAEGEIVRPIAYETLRQDNNQIAIQYYFENDPKDMTLIYKTPAAIVEVPVKIQFKDIPLP